MCGAIANKKSSQMTVALHRLETARRQVIQVARIVSELVRIVMQLLVGQAA